MPWEKQFDVDAVLERAMRAFWSRGYEATSMQDLVDCTGVNRGSLYATYGDKHALFLASLRMYDDRVRRRLLAELESRHAPREAIRQLFLAFAAPAPRQGACAGCFLTNTALELSGLDPEAGRIVARAQEEMEAFFARMIRKAKARGEVSAQLKPAAAASGLLASLLGLVVLSRSRPEPALLQTVVDDALRRLE